MMRATVDLLGMYRYDNTLLDNLIIPQALDKEVLKDNLLLEAAELEVIYPDPEFLKAAIGSWSRKQLPVWVELYDTTQYEYNPIWNKDGKISEVRDFKATEDVTENVDRVDNLTDKNTKNLKDVTETEYKNTTDRTSKDHETRNLQDETLNSVYGFNSSNDAPANKDLNKATGTDTMDRTGKDIVDHDGKDTINRTGTDTVDHTGRQDIDRKIDRDTTDKGTITRIEQGNIGVTSTQSLIKEQREVVNYNVMDIIIQDFIDRFCLKVY